MDELTKDADKMEKFVTETTLIYKKTTDKLSKSLVMNILFKTIATYMILHNTNLQIRQNQP